MNLAKTPLYSWHKSRAKMVPFAGYEMPVVYNAPSSISKEHLAVREKAGLFDVSHMGRMLVKGSHACQFLDLLVPRDISKVPVDKVAYCYMLNENAGFRDDLTIARIAEDEYLVTWNAGNYQKIWTWVTELSRLVKTLQNWDFTITDITKKTAMFAFQGPLAPALVDELFGAYPGPWKITQTTYRDISLIVMGSGYTGERGVEITVLDTSVENPANALAVWEHILDSTADRGVLPCGLGARDTLRTEAGMPLYGNDILETITPVEAGLVFPALVNFDKPYFMGKDALLKAEANKQQLLTRVGLIAQTKGRSPRPTMKLFLNDQEVGFVTSGVFSPLLQKGIGMGYIKRDIAIETVLEAKIENKKPISVIVKNFPLFDPDKYGGKRKS